jgi:hypothetical protein
MQLSGSVTDARLKSEPALNNSFCITLYCMHRVHYTLFMKCVLTQNASSSGAPAAWKQQHKTIGSDCVVFFLVLSTKQTYGEN